MDNCMDKLRLEGWGDEAQGDGGLTSWLPTNVVVKASFFTSPYNFLPASHGMPHAPKAAILHSTIKKSTTTCQLIGPALHIRRGRLSRGSGVGYVTMCHD